MKGLVAVWGATGFVGRHLVDALLAKGVTIRALCRDTMQDSAAWRGQVQIRHLELEADEAEFRRALDGVSCVVHCAGTPGPDPRSLRAYELGTAALARSAAAMGVQSLILLSTVSVYGSQVRGEVGVETSPLPDSAYGACRLRAECAARDELAGSSTKKLAVVRVPAVVGLGMQGRVLSRFQRGLRTGLFFHPGEPSAGLPCIGVHRLADRLAAMALSEPASLPDICQLADFMRWVELARIYEEVSGSRVRRIPFPKIIALAISNLLPHLGLSGPLAALSNVTKYRNEEPDLLAEVANDVASTRDDVAELFGAQLGA
ncbi:MAG: NAD-dependent epimerase/dehydratase family protein [Deltaproteobacteria bacterium]|nr:NAD-dependent epimerase/dehydratase family protein [Deltaproteobacteria bacterium]